MLPDEPAFVVPVRSNIDPLFPSSPAFIVSIRTSPEEYNPLAPLLSTTLPPFAPTEDPAAMSILPPTLAT